MVFLDLFATWCGPCEVSLVYIKELNEMYPSHILQIMSIDVDNSETDQQVSDFRDSHNMNWIVGIDYDESIDNDYGTGSIPTFYLIDSNGKVVWSHIGSDISVNEISGIISNYFEDTEAPTFDKFNILQKETEFSIYYPHLKVSGNISDNWDVFSAEIVITSSIGTEIFPLNLKKNGTSAFFSTSLSISPKLIYPDSTIDISLKAKDFFNNSNQTTISNYPVTHYEDLGPPLVISISYSYTMVDNKYDVEVLVEIEEDLLLTTSKIYLMKEEKIVKSLNLEVYNSTHMIAEGTVLNSLALADEIVIKLIIEDVAGNSLELQYALVPKKTNSSSLITTIVIFVIYASYILIKRKD